MALLCTNSDGSDKLVPIVIGKSVKPLFQKCKEATCDLLCQFESMDGVGDLRLSTCS
jgi:hypothetical protein